MDFKNILLDLMHEQGINQRQLSNAAGIPATTISGWLNANRLPDYYALIKLGRFFDVSADYLLGVTEDEETPRLTNRASAPLPLDEKELLTLYRKLPYEGKQRLIARAEVMLEDAEQKNKHGA